MRYEAIRQYYYVQESLICVLSGSLNDNCGLIRPCSDQLGESYDGPLGWRPLAATPQVRKRCFWQRYLYLWICSGWCAPLAVWLHTRTKTANTCSTLFTACTPYSDDLNNDHLQNFSARNFILRIWYLSRKEHPSRLGSARGCPD